MNRQGFRVVPFVDISAFFRISKLPFLRFSINLEMPRVELIISYNASPVETQLVVKDFVAQGLRALNPRNVENVGSNQNFLQMF